MSSKLYRVIREHYYNGGTGYEQVNSTEVLYCGYDRDEAVRVYCANEPEDKHASPGSYGNATRFQSMDPATVADEEVESTAMGEEDAEPETLADYLECMPVDGPTGQPLADTEGRPDRLADYEILERRPTADGFRALVRGPSGDVDLVVDDATGARIYRDTEITSLRDA